jgi:hypothetical protein
MERVSSLWRMQEVKKWIKKKQTLTTLLFIATFVASHKRKLKNSLLALVVIFAMNV